MKSLSISLATILACLIAAAQEPQRSASGDLAERFQQLDRSGDGKPMWDELPKNVPFDQRNVKMPRIFSQIDKDGDGTVPVPRDFQTWFNQLDKDGNRVIEEGEADSRTLRGADRNADGRITVREGQRYHGDLLAKQAAFRNPEIYEPWKRTTGQEPLRAVESGDPLLNLRFTRSLPTGEKDASGTLITGTQCMHLETHQGMLFATLSG